MEPICKLLEKGAFIASSTCKRVTVAGERRVLGEFTSLSPVEV